MRKYHIGFFDSGDELVASLGSMVLPESIAYHDSYLECLLDEDTEESAVIAVLSKAASWDGNIFEINEEEEVEEVEEPEELPEVAEEPVADVLSDIFQGDGDDDPLDLEFLDIEIGRAANRYGLAPEQVIEVYSSVISWFLPFTGNPGRLVVSLKDTNIRLSALIQDRLRMQYLNKIVELIEGNTDPTDHIASECAADVLYLIQDHWNDLLSGGLRGDYDG